MHTEAPVLKQLVCSHVSVAAITSLGLEGPQSV